MIVRWSRLAGKHGRTTLSRRSQQRWVPGSLTLASHIFCLDCASQSGLTSQTPEHHRVCPACRGQLSRPDDAVISNLNPTEDYKISVLSGLSPNVIMECAGRALSFWAYQMTQEMFVHPETAAL